MCLVKRTKQHCSALANACLLHVLSSSTLQVLPLASQVQLLPALPESVLWAIPVGYLYQTLTSAKRSLFLLPPTPEY